MSFKTAVAETPNLGVGAFHLGLRALEPTDRARIRCADTRRLRGSVNLDSALQASHQHSHRWDYGICYSRGGEIVYWVEVHPASPRDVDAVAQKFAWLKDWLASDGYRLRAFEPQYIWISSGETSFTKGSPQVKRLAQTGVRSSLVTPSGERCKSVENQYFESSLGLALGAGPRSHARGRW